MQPNYTIEYSNPLRTTSIHLESGDTIITDAPTDNNGKGEAFSPTDLLSTSLVTCVMTILGIATERSGGKIISISARVNKTMGTNPRRVSKISATIMAKLAGVEETECARLEKLSRACPVAKSLSSDLIQDLKFEFTIDKR